MADTGKHILLYNENHMQTNRVPKVTLKGIVGAAKCAETQVV